MKFGDLFFLKNKVFRQKFGSVSPFGALSLKKRILQNVWTLEVFQKLEITGDIGVLVWLFNLSSSLFFIGEILSKRTIDNFEKLSDFGGVHARSEGRKIKNS